MITSWNAPLPQGTPQRYAAHRATTAPAPATTPVPGPVALSVSADFPAFWVKLVLLSAVFCLPVLALLNANGLPASSGMVALIEALVFCLCLLLQVQRIPAWSLALLLGLLSWLVLNWLLRQSLDIKSARDLLIPLLFFSLGRMVVDAGWADRLLCGIVLVVLAVGLFEAVFPDAYGSLLDTFSFYSRLGSIRESAAMFAGQTLTLNGYRPEGIGRTLLPAVLGQHRISSVFLEPVSLGNFAVIVLAWQLAKDWQALRLTDWLLLACALLLIVLADSRFGMLMALALPVMRLLPHPLSVVLARAYPLLALAGILALAWWLPVVGDNLLGRLSVSGLTLLDFGAARLLGLDSPLPDYGDMGFAYALSRFGVLLVLALLAVLFLLPAPSERAERLRGLLVLYVFSSLAISGTSVFALKTAGLMWFLLGTLFASWPVPARTPQGSRV